METFRKSVIRICCLTVAFTTIVGPLFSINTDSWTALGIVTTMELLVLTANYKDTWK